MHMDRLEYNTSLNEPRRWKLTFADHADSETLLKATELASVPVAFVDDTVVSGQTHVLSAFLHCSLSTPVANTHRTSSHEKDTNSYTDVS